MIELGGALVAPGEEPPGVRGHRAVGVRVDVGQVARGEVVLLLEGLRVVRVELEGAVVAGLDVERAAGVREPVLAVVRLGEPDEELRAHRALLGRNVLAGRQPLHDERRELLLQPCVVLVDLPGARQGPRGAREVVRRLARGGLVAEERELALRVALDRELRLVHLDGVVPLPEGLVDLACAVDGVRARRLEVDRAAEVLQRLLRLLQAVAP